MRKSYPDTLAGVQEMFRDTALDAVVEAVEKMVADGVARWVRDPEVQNVWGLVYTELPGDTLGGQVLVVAYVEDADFEVSELAHEALPI